MSKYWVRQINAEDDASNGLFGHQPNDETVEASNMLEAANLYAQQKQMTLPARITVVDYQLTTQGWYKIEPTSAFNIRVERGIALKADS